MQVINVDKMKIATFNIQNIFHRDISFKQNTAGKMFKNWIMEIDLLMRKSKKTIMEQDRIRELSFLIGFEKSNSEAYAVLRRKAGVLYLKSAHHSNDTKASDLTNWNGWIKIQTTPINPEAINNKAKAIADINADILLLQEVEDKSSLDEFNHSILPKFKCESYASNFVFPFNDLKGLNTAILLKKGYELKNIKIHNLDNITKPDSSIIEFEILTPQQKIIWILSVYIPKQKEIQDVQIKNIAQVYKTLLSEGKISVIIAGTLNTPSFSNALVTLIEKTSLKDITRHLSFDVVCDKGNDANYFRLGAYRKGVNIKQEDYLFVSPILFNKIKDSGLNRKAIWPEKQPLWSTYKSVSNSCDSASEHPLVWGDIEV